MVSYIAPTLNKGFHHEGRGLEHPHLLTSLHPCNTIALSQTLSYARPLSMVWAVHLCECSSSQTAAVQTAMVSGSSGIWGAQTPCETPIIPFLKSEQTQTISSQVSVKRKRKESLGRLDFLGSPTQGLRWSWVDFLPPHTGPPTWQLYFVQVRITDGNW